MKTPQHFARLAAGITLAALLASVVAYAGQKPKDWNPLVDPGNFVSVVDNPYFPLAPGHAARFEQKGGDETLRIEVTRTTRTIMGVPTLEVIETAALGGQTVEISKHRYAQDRDGNVWYFGETTQLYENGAPAGTEGSWEAGVAGAMPGIIMKGQPQSGETYFQEYAPGLAEDMATVLDIDGTESTERSTYSNVLRVKEWNPLSSNSLEHKYYAPGVGLFLEVEGSKRLELVAIE